MDTILLTLLTALVVATIAPFLASLVPGRAIPEVVFLVFAGALLGPHGVLHLISTSSSAMDLISDLGMGFLFLMAGYEMSPRDLLGHTGRVAAGSWLASLLLGYAVVALVFSRWGFGQDSWMTMAILMTTTAYGTLAPIMRDRNLSGTPVGHVVTIYGSMGELLPILAMAFLLSGKSPVVSVVSLAVFVLACLVPLVFSRRLKVLGTRFWRFVSENSESSSFPMMRLVVSILVYLLFATALFGLDGVLGAFAAGFILRALFPGGNEALERNLRVLGSGFFTPIFFVVSGAGIDLAAALSNLPLLVGFIVALMVVRGLVVALSLRLDRETRSLSWQELFSSAAYCTMALPLVVAITSVAVEGGVLSDSVSSVLVTSAALTVLLIPVVTSLVRMAGAAEVAEAVVELTSSHATVGEVLHAHQETFRERQERYRKQLIRAHERGERLSATEYLAHGGYRAPLGFDETGDGQDRQDGQEDEG